MRVRRLARFWHSHGASRALYRAIHGMIRILAIDRWVAFQIAEVFATRISEIKYYPQFRGRFEIRQAGRDDEAALQSFFQKPREVADRFSRQDVCIILCSDGRILAAEWVALGPNIFREDRATLRCVFRFPAGSCWLYDGLCDENNPGAWGMLMVTIRSQLEELGVREAFFQIDYQNVGSVVSHKALGCQSRGRVVHVKLLGWSLRMYKTHGERWQVLPAQTGHLELYEK